MKKSLKEIMAEQTAQQIEERKKEQDEKARQKQYIDERMGCVTIDGMKTYRTDQELSQFIDDNRHLYKRYFEFDINGAIKSLSVPENMNKTLRYIHADYEKVEGQTSKGQFRKLMEIAKFPFLHLELYYMYTHHDFIIWTENGLWKALQFYFCRCPSGGCDSEHIDLLVGVDPDDLLNLIYHVKIHKEDKERIFAELRKF